MPRRQAMFGFGLIVVLAVVDCPVFDLVVPDLTLAILFCTAGLTVLTGFAVLTFLTLETEAIFFRLGADFSLAARLRNRLDLLAALMSDRFGRAERAATRCPRRGRRLLRTGASPTRIKRAGKRILAGAVIATVTGAIVIEATVVGRGSAIRASQMRRSAR